MTSVTTFSWTANLSSSRRLHTAFDIRQMDGGRFHDTFLTQILPLILLAIDITIDQPQKTMRMCFKYIPLVWEVFINFDSLLAEICNPLCPTRKKNSTCSKRIYYFCRLEYEILGGNLHIQSLGFKNKSAMGALVGMVFFARKKCPCSHLQVL